MASGASTTSVSASLEEAQPTRFPRRMKQAETALVKARRKAAGEDEDALPVVGIALSGGGIRSATFSLGVLQGLAKLGLLKRFDYLSTVSGGGYAGGFLGALFCRPADDEGRAPRPSAKVVEEGLSAPQTPPEPGPGAIHRSVKWLRENGRYLTPGGSGDGFWAAAALLRNLLAVHVVMSLLWMWLLLAMDRIGWHAGAIAPTRYLVPGLGWELYRSPWLLSSSAALVAAAVLFGWAYWLVPQGRAKGRPYLAWPIWGVVVLVGWTLVAHLLDARVGGWKGLPPSLGFLSFISVCAALLAIGAMQDDAHRQDQGRNELTGLLRLGLLLSVALASYGLIDTVGWTFWVRWFGPQESMSGKGVSWLEQLFSKNGLMAAVASALVMFREKLQGLLGKEKAETALGKIYPALIRLFTGLSAMALGAVGLGALSALAHLLTFGRMSGHPIALAGGWGYTALLLGGLGLLVLVMSRVIGFLNLSTLGPTYTSALTRSYVGASNPKRRAGEVSPHLIPQDDLAWKDYRPWEAGGPLHLINATLNETTGGKSQVMQKDRKGMNLAVGPVGLSVGLQHHALWEEGGPNAKGIPKPDGHSVFGKEGAAFSPEPLTVDQWVGISGAAASTGMGSRTSLLYSLWLGFLNVRLGYWWWSGLTPTSSFRTWLEGFLPVHTHLLEEWTAHFPGTHSRHWYLSDGGHFENTAAYELVRRRLPFILLCDNGADAERELDDLSNLVAKARLDLAAEIRVLDAEGLKVRFSKGVPAGLGSLDELRDPKGAALAALAEVDYLDARGAVEQKGTILIFKPTMSPKVPLDVQAYRRINPDFPQQTTGDQFYDEAQWESYRRLGEFAAMEILRSKEDVHPSLWF